MPIKFVLYILYLKKSSPFFNAEIGIVDGNRWQLKKYRWGKFLLSEKTVGNEDKIKENYLLWTSLIVNRYILLIQNDKWFVENSWKTRQTSHQDGIRPSKRSNLKHFWMLYSQIENNVRQSWNESASRGIVMHSQSQRFFVGSVKKFRTWKFFTKTFYARVTLFTQITP